MIVALRNEKGSYNVTQETRNFSCIVALRNEKGSYNVARLVMFVALIVALRNEKGSYNSCVVFKVMFVSMPPPYTN